MQEICWICGKAADSSEHIFKAKDLRRFFDRDGYKFENLPQHFKEGRQDPIRGPNATRMKYPKSVCSKCNNVDTAPFDRAYDQLTEWIVASKNDREPIDVDWHDLFGDSWDSDLTRLKRYCAKSLGCRIIASGSILSPNFPNPVSGTNLERLNISICKAEPFRSLPNYDHETFGFYLGKGDLFGSWSKDDEEQQVILTAVWWENVGHFQINYWFNILPNSQYGDTLNEKTQRYKIRTNENDQGETRFAMQNWVSLPHDSATLFLFPIIWVIISAYAFERLSAETSMEYINNLIHEFEKLADESLREVRNEIYSYRTHADLSRTTLVVRNAAEFLIGTTAALLGFVHGRGRTNAPLAEKALSAISNSKFKNLIKELPNALHEELSDPSNETSAEEALKKLSLIAHDVYDKLGFVLSNDGDRCYVDIPFRTF